MWSIVFLTNQKDYEPIDGAQKFLSGGLGRWACGVWRSVAGRCRMPFDKLPRLRPLPKACRGRHSRAGRVNSLRVAGFALRVRRFFTLTGIVGSGSV